MSDCLRQNFRNIQEKMKNEHNKTSNTYNTHETNLALTHEHIRHGKMLLFLLQIPLANSPL